jgi:hypothetical protein
MPNSVLLESVASSASYRVVGYGVTASASGHLATHVPHMFIPENQLYFWTPEWQAGEEAALLALARGDSREFDNPLDAVRWLLSTDD